MIESQFFFYGGRAERRYCPDGRMTLTRVGLGSLVAGLKIVQTFVCDELETGDTFFGVGSGALVADYSVRCDGSERVAWLVYGFTNLGK